MYPSWGWKKTTGNSHSPILLCSGGGVLCYRAKPLNSQAKCVQVKSCSAIPVLSRVPNSQLHLQQFSGTKDSRYRSHRAIGLCFQLLRLFRRISWPMEIRTGLYHSRPHDPQSEATSASQRQMIEHTRHARRSSPTFMHLHAFQTWLSYSTAREKFTKPRKRDVGLTSAAERLLIDSYRGMYARAPVNTILMCNSNIMRCDR
jgi:hypothetical protein